jgi:transposase-like protein
MDGTVNKRSFLDGPAFKLSSAQELEVVRLHNEDVSTAGLAIRFNVSEGTILRILHRHGALKPRNATAREKKIILRMSRRRKTRAEIGKVLGRSCSFVFNWQKKLHCQLQDHRPTEQEKDEICKLYVSGLGQVVVAKKTGFTQRTILTTLAERGIPHHRTARPPALTAEKRRQAVTLIRARNSYLKDIAKKLGVNRNCIEKLAHQILGIERFFGGQIWPPLQSAFPERHDARLSTAGYVEFLTKLFPAGLPEKPPWEIVPPIISMLLEKFPFWRSASTAELLSVESHLTAALSMMRGAEQGGLVN